MRQFRATRKGVVAAFTPGEAELLGDLAGQLIALLTDRSAESTAGAGSDPGDVLLAQLGIGGGDSLPLDPAVARLLPDAYRGDDEAASEHRRLTESGLIDRKIANARTVIATLAALPGLLDGTQVQAWLRTLTDLRLTIAARLEIERDGDEGRIESDSDFALHAAYDWLGYLQGTLVDAIDR
ncbi:DUF2017 domain-containing protein [soil metagenome]